jgi:hypothetical protein
MAHIRKKIKIDLGQIVAQIQSDRRIGEDRKVFFEGMLAENFVTILETYLEVSPEIPEAEKRRMIWGALGSNPQQRLELNSIVSEVSRREAAYNQTTGVDYIFATSISLTPVLAISRARSAKAAISFHKSLPRKISRKELKAQFQLALHEPNPKHYTTVLVRLNSRSIPEAWKVALEELDYFRGIWNYLNNYGVFIFGSPKLKPVNQIRLGQVHTLHDSSGKVVDRVFGDYWYEPNYVYGPAFKISRSDWQRIKKLEKRIRARIDRCPYSSDLVRAFVRYGRALDNPDLETAFLKLWSLLEFLTSSGENYELLRRRVAFLFEESTIVSQILQHLRDRRNNFVHSAVETDRTRSLLFQIKPYVERVLEFHIVRGAKFKNREDATSYLDLPKDPKNIRTEIKRRQMALAFRNPKR